MVVLSYRDTGVKGKPRCRTSMLLATLSDMHEQPRSAPPQATQHARRILLKVDFLAGVMGRMRGEEEEKHVNGWEQYFTNRSWTSGNYSGPNTEPWGTPLEKHVCYQDMYDFVI